MNDKPGSVIGGILLVAGSCIGAGMLGLPILTGLAGFLPSLIVFIAAWLFMTITGLLLIEVNGRFRHQVNIITMVGETLGPIGRVLSWLLYLFLFYSLLVAYISGSGSLFATFMKQTFGAGFTPGIYSVFFTVFFGSILYFGTRPVDLWNRVLMMGKITAYFGLIFVGIREIEPSLLLRTQPSFMFASLPVLVISFGYHNMIPTLTAYMKGDLRRVRLTIIGGGLFALVVYLVWEIIVLGIVPVGGTYGLLASYNEGKEGAQALTGILGTTWVTTFAQVLAFFAILTSFLAQALALIHFLADGLKIKSEKKENTWLCALTLLPPLIFALLNPHLFFTALNFAGGICAVILFGVFPVLMIWIGRYRKQVLSDYRVPGGKPLLVGVLLFALMIFFFQLSSMLGASYIPKP